MEINNGWIRWERVGETLDIELQSIQYNKNGNPYAVGEIISDNEEPRKVMFNIGKADVGLKPARYLVKCTYANNGFGFVSLKLLQDSSWDIHDESSDVEEEVGMDMETLLPSVDTPKVKEAEMVELEEVISATLKAGELFNKYTVKDHDCSECDCHYDVYEDILEGLFGEYGKLMFNNR